MWANRIFGILAGLGALAWVAVAVDLNAVFEALTTVGLLAVAALVAWHVVPLAFDTFAWLALVPAASSRHGDSHWPRVG